MSYLTEVFPPARSVENRLPVTRDQVMLLLAAITELFLGIDIYFAHSISGTIKTNEWIPIVFGILAGIVLLLAGLIALRNRPLATVLANIVFLGSIIVGLLGAYFHLVRANLIGGGVPVYRSCLGADLGASAARTAVLRLERGAGNQRRLDRGSGEQWSSAASGSRSCTNAL